MPKGTCAEMAVGKKTGRCERIVHDHSVVGTVNLPRDAATSAGAGAVYRDAFMDLGGDVRSVRRTIDPSSYRSASMSGSIHIGLAMFAERWARYVDIGVTAGLELGVIKFDTVVRGRADYHVGGYLDLTLPDVGPLRYLEQGVPGIRIGAQWTEYAQGWQGGASLELGLLWRWGVERDVYVDHFHKMMGD